MNTKRWVALVTAALLFIAMVYVVGRAAGTVPLAGGPFEEFPVEGEGADKIALIEVEGEIVSTEEEALGEGASAEELRAQLRQAARDDAVKAVILRVNSPGGSVVASDEIYRQVVELRRAGKTVVASMGEVAASGGYFISAGADSIVANPSTITGSIGVILVLLNLEGATGKLGVEPVVFISGRLKDIGSPFRDMTEEERQILQRLLDESYERFVEVVAEGRHMDELEVREIADGRPLSGFQAQRSGLVDTLGDLDTAIEEARRLAGLEEATVVEYRRPLSLADLL
ncbi:MAG TPA: signal peptide peptidase SppA, partial [Chloroflexota bacterium]|nr:signal peptide peptidase SppA [Chloroflexota bacterium]